MFHSNTETLTDYWRARVPAFGCPPRASVDPTEFLPLLPQVFILGRSGAGQYPFRLVGGHIANLHDRDLRGEGFLGLWQSPDRASLQSAMEGAARRAHPLVVDARGRTAAGEIDLEILLAPLAGPDGGATRYLGLYQQTGPAGRVAAGPLKPLSVRRIGVMAGGALVSEAPRLRLAALDGRRIA